jgi:hypothetical protein
MLRSDDNTMSKKARTHRQFDDVNTVRRHPAPVEPSYPQARSSSWSRTDRGPVVHSRSEQGLAVAVDAAEASPT